MLVARIGNLGELFHLVHRDPEWNSDDDAPGERGEMPRAPSRGATRCNEALSGVTMRAFQCFGGQCFDAC